MIRLIQHHIESQKSGTYNYDNAVSDLKKESAYRYEVITEKTKSLGLKGTERDRNLTIAHQAWRIAYDPSVKFYTHEEWIEKTNDAVVKREDTYQTMKTALTEKSPS